MARLPSRLYASIPADDPRYTDLREFLGTIKRTGKSSPTARMLGEWALLGYLFTTGKIGGGSVEIATMPADLPDPAEVLAAKRQLEAAAAQLGGFGEE